MLRKGPAIALLAVLLGVIVLAFSFALQPQKQASTKTDGSATAAVQAPVIPEAIRGGAAAAAGSASASAMNPPASGRPRVPVYPPEPGAGDGRESPRWAASSSSGASARRARFQQDEKASGAGILFDAKSDVGTSGPPAASRTSAPGAPGGTSGGDRTAAASGDAADDPNRQDRKNAFIDSRGAGKTTDYLLTTLQHPRSPFELKAGSIIPAVLVTGINSDLPGPVIGQVRESVYDTVTGNHLLIPQGSRLLATYDSMVSWGQERVLLCWNRLLLPNGDSVNLECMPASDLNGAAGLTDEVNEHWWRLLKGAAIASVLAASAQGLAGNVNGTNPTVPQMWANGAAGQVNQVGQQVTRRELNVQPTITVRPGFSVNVLVTKDVILPPYGSSAR